MTTWVEQIERADAERARTLDRAWAVLADDIWPGALAAFEVYLVAEDVVQAHQLLGTPKDSPAFATALDAVDRHRDYLEAHVDDQSQGALDDHYQACLLWRAQHRRAFEAMGVAADRSPSVGQRPEA